MGQLRTSAPPPVGASPAGPEGGGLRFVALGGVTGLVVLVAALLWGGGAPVAPTAGLPDAGAGTGWGLPVATFVMYAAGALCVGTLVAAAFVAPSDGPTLRPGALRALRAATWWALLWAGAAAVTFVLTLSDILAQPVSAVLDGTTLLSFGWSIPQGQALVWVVGLTLVVAATSRLVGTVPWAIVVAAVGVVALLPPAFSGHAAQAGSHDVATSSLVAHVVAASLWIGGLAAVLVHLRRAAFAFSLQRFSALGLWCFLAVAVSGAVNAWVRLGSLSSLVTTSYGLLVLGKLAALVVLGAMGVTYRRRLLGGLRDGELTARVAALRLAAGEVVVMGATLGLAVALSRTPTPPRAAPLSRLASILGYDLPPFAWSELLSQWRPDTVVLLLAATVLVWYLAGARRLARSGVRWPVLRTVAFVSGVLVVVVTMSSGVMAYGPAMFSVHMISHMVLTMCAPILLALGMPITLALRALPAAPHDGPWGPREWLLSFLHSHYFRLLTHPLVALFLYVVTLYAYYLSPLFEASQDDHVVHVLVQVHFLAVGCLFYFVVLGLDPMPRKLPEPARMVLLVASMPFHAFFAVTILQMPGVLAAAWYDSLGLPWLTDRLADQRLGAGVAWVFAELPALAVLAALFVQWARSDERGARARERRIDAGTDTSLEDYNAYLARLAEHEPKQPRAGG